MDLVPWSWSRKAGSKAVKTAVKISARAVPLVKTVEVGHGIFKAVQVAHNISDASERLGEFLPKASLVADDLHEFIPSMQVMGRSLCDSVKIFASFNTIAMTVGIAANVVMTYQGVQALQLIAARLQDISATLAAQTALMAQEKFPGYSYKMLKQRLGETVDDPVCDHWFFLYHPDNDWYPEFYHLLETAPLGPRFCGYTNQIDTVFVFMLAARKRQTQKEKKAEKEGQPLRPVKFHLVIPAYQPILVAERLKIPEGIGDFVMEGRINSNKEFVWFDLPSEQRHYLLGIGQWVRPRQGWWDWAKSSVKLAEKLPPIKDRRVLGTGQKPKLGGDPLGDPSPASDSDNESEEKDITHHPPERAKNRHNATSLHQQQSRRHKNRNRQRKIGDREKEKPRSASSGKEQRGRTTPSTAG